MCCTTECPDCNKELEHKIKELEQQVKDAYAAGQAEAPDNPHVGVSNSSVLLCPPELVDLVRFLAETWAMTEDNRYKIAAMEPEEMKDFLITKWPVVQGTMNQLNLTKIGEQPYKKENISKAVAWMLKA